MRGRAAAFIAMAIFAASISLPCGGFTGDDLPPPAGAAAYPQGLVHTVDQGDTLWDLAAKYLGSPWKWQEIWERNRFLTNPHYIYPGIEIVVFPPPARDIAIAVAEPPMQAPPEAAEKPAAKAAPPPVVKPPTLDISPSEYVRAGEFLKEVPRGIGRIRGGDEPKVAFSEGDKVHLDLDREIPDGQLLGVYRVRGPITEPGGRFVTGYVKHLVGLIQTKGKRSGVAAGVVRTSFEDLWRQDLISEEIPSYAPVVLSAGKAGKVEAGVISGQWENKELSAGQFIFLDRGTASDVAVGDVFRLFTEAGNPPDGTIDARTGVFVEIGQAVVVRVSRDFSTAYVTRSYQSFPAGVKAVRNGEARR